MLLLIMPSYLIFSILYKTKLPFIVVMNKVSGVFFLSCLNISFHQNLVLEVWLGEKGFQMLESRFKLTESKVVSTSQKWTQLN